MHQKQQPLRKISAKQSKKYIKQKCCNRLRSLCAKNLTRLVTVAKDTRRPRTNLCFVLEGLDEGRSPHGLRLDDLIVECGLNLVEGGEDADAGIAIFQRVEDDLVPVLLHSR